MINQEELYSKDAENNLIAILLMDVNKVATIISLINDSDFYKIENRLIFNAVRKLQQDDKPIDIVTVSELLKFENTLAQAGGREYISTLAENYVGSTLYKNYVKIILKYSKKRKMLSISKDIEDRLNKGEDVDDVAKDINSKVEEIILSRTGNSLVQIGSAVPDVMDKVDKILSGQSKTLGLPTGFYQLDRALSGLCKGRLYLLGARPAMGKSAIAQQIAEYIGQSKRVMFVACEMDVDEYTERSLFRRCNINQDMLTRGTVNSEQIFSSMAEQMQAMSGLGLHILDKAGATISDIESEIITMQSKGGCDLIIVDYLQLMNSDNKYLHDPKDIVSEISNKLKNLARKYKIPILALSQLSRALEIRADKRPIMSDLRESGSLEQDADVVMFLYRDEVYNPKEPSSRGSAELIIRKNRQGRLGTINMMFDGARTAFSEVQQWQR